MTRNSHSRRQVLKRVGTGAVGIAGVASMRSGATSTVGATVNDRPELSSIDDLNWVETDLVEGDNVVDVCLSVGYYGSELQSRWVDDEIVDRWVHFFDATMTSHCESDTDCYNIDSQRFDTRFYSGTEHNGVPSAGAAAWPDPPGGNWSQVVDTVVEESLGTLSTLVGLGQSVDEIIDAYNAKPFDTEQTDKIEFEADYSAYTRKTASHSVNFTADQVPGTDGMVDILSGAGDVGHDHITSALVYLYPDSGDMNKNPPSSTDAEGIRDTLDAMSQEQLSEYDTLRVNPSEISQTMRKNSRFDLSSERPTYIRYFDVDVEFGAENGTVVSSPSENR